MVLFQLVRDAGHKDFEAIHALVGPSWDLSLVPQCMGGLGGGLV
jgi:hypothetical protein